MGGDEARVRKGETVRERERERERGREGRRRGRKTERGGRGEKRETGGRSGKEGCFGGGWWVVGALTAIIVDSLDHGE